MKWLITRAESKFSYGYTRRLERYIILWTNDSNLTASVVIFIYYSDRNIYFNTDKIWIYWVVGKVWMVFKLRLMLVFLIYQNSISKLNMHHFDQ